VLQGVSRADWAAMGWGLERQQRSGLELGECMVQSALSGGLVCSERGAC
jgi:hypothetical protein